MTGLLLIIIGIIFLLKNLEVISGSAWDTLWPVLLIVAGINLILRRNLSGFFLAPLESCFFGSKKKQDAGQYAKEERFGWRKRRIGEKNNN